VGEWTGYGEPMRVLIADDQCMMREALRALFLKAPDIENVTEAADGAEVIEHVRRETFDVVVLDIAMPNVSGIAALATIKREQPALPVVMYSTTADEFTVRKCLAMGAAGYVAKESAFDELIQAVRAVIAGQKYLCRRPGSLDPAQLGELSVRPCMPAKLVRPLS
jgi:DNA-binding NarL/FixJ family response regulator